MSQQSCISIHNLSFHYDAEPIFDEVSLQIYMRDHICLIGRNGAGKSTLLKQRTIATRNKTTYSNWNPDSKAHELQKPFKFNTNENQ